MTDWLLDGVLGLLLLGLAGGALHVRQLYAGVLLFVSFGLVLALVWARLGAADLALAEAAIGAGLTGVLLFAALARQPLAGSEPRLSGRRRLAAVLVLLPLLIVLLPQLAPLAEQTSRVPMQIDAAMAQSGVDHPVTAVLLNFRAWDTLLELAVLLLALLGARQLGPLRMQLSEPWPLLQAWGRTLAPLLVLAGGYVLWRGLAGWRLPGRRLARFRHRPAAPGRRVAGAALEPMAAAVAGAGRPVAVRRGGGGLRLVRCGLAAVSIRLGQAADSRHRSRGNAVHRRQPQPAGDRRRNGDRAMNATLFWIAIGFALWLLGLHGLLTLRHALRRIIAINLMGSGVFLVMIALAARHDPSDPLLVALVVTGLVVAVSATALALRLSSALAAAKEHER